MENNDDPVSKDFLVRINEVYKRIQLGEIYYLASEGKYVSIVAVDRQYSFRSSLKYLETVLPSNFIRVHTSSIVNLDMVSGIKVKDNVIVLKNNKEVPYSRSYKSVLFAHFLLG